jgi:hypothetical protein
MKDFKVVINGQNFLIQQQDQVILSGFYAPRFVNANTSEEAQEQAMHLVINSPSLRNVICNTKENPPKLLVDEILETPISEEDKANNHLFMFYAEDDDE